MNTDVKTKNSRGKILRLFRIARDMSIKELSEKMQISSSYISDVERGVRNPSIETCKKYSDAFGVPLSVIIFFDEELTEHGYNYRKLLISILEKVELIDNRKDEKSL